MNLWRLIRGVLMALLIAPCGCGGGEREAEVTLIVGPEPESIDPAEVRSLNAGRISDTLFEGLTNLNISNPLEPLPGLASAWEISDDGITYTFHLREAGWSNGEPITAGDFVYSWRRVLTRPSDFEYVNLLFYLKNGKRYYDGEVPFGEVGVRASGDRTLVVTLERRTPQFLQLTAFTTLRPVYRPCIERHSQKWTRPQNIVCSGPYVLAEWRVNHRIVLHKNRRYWDADSVRAERVAFLSVASENTALNLYEAGHADLITRVPGPIIDALKTRDDFHGSQAFGTIFIRFNTGRKPFTDPRVRKAFALAIDREALVRHVTRGDTEPAGGLVPPSTPGYRPIGGLRFDPGEARRLLAEAGYQGGNGFPPVAYLYTKNENDTEIAQVLKAGWKEVLNVEVALDGLEGKIYGGRRSRLEYDLAHGNWYGDYVEPSAFLDLFTGTNHFNQTGWSNPAYDRLISEAQGAAALDSRVAAYMAAERLLVEGDVPITPLFHSATTNMYRKSLRGMVPNVRNVIRVKDLRVDRAGGDG